MGEHHLAVEWSLDDSGAFNCETGIGAHQFAIKSRLSDDWIPCDFQLFAKSAHRLFGAANDVLEAQNDHSLSVELSITQHRFRGNAPPIDGVRWPLFSDCRFRVVLGGRVPALRITNNLNEPSVRIIGKKPFHMNFMVGQARRECGNPPLSTEVALIIQPSVEKRRKEMI